MWVYQSNQSNSPALSPLVVFPNLKSRWKFELSECFLALVFFCSTWDLLGSDPAVHLLTELRIYSGSKFSESEACVGWGCWVRWWLISGANAQDETASAVGNCDTALNADRRRWSGSNTWRVSGSVGVWSEKPSTCCFECRRCSLNHWFPQRPSLAASSAVFG